MAYVVIPETLAPYSTSLESCSNLSASVKKRDWANNSKECCSSILGLSAVWLSCQPGLRRCWAEPDQRGRKGQSMQETDNSLNSTECWSSTYTRPHQRFVLPHVVQTCSLYKESNEHFVYQSAATDDVGIHFKHHTINRPGNVSSIFSRRLFDIWITN